MSTQKSAVQLTRAHEAEVLDSDPGSVITLLADVSHTGGKLTSNRSFLKKGSAGAPPHLHTEAAEMFFVLDGVLDVLLDDEIITLNKGDFLVVPPHTRHAFAPTQENDADVLFVFAPGRERFDYYRMLDQAHAGLIGWDDIAASGERFDNHYSESATWARHLAQ